MARGGRRPGAGRKPKAVTTPAPVAPVRHPGGRPSKYDPTFCDMVVAFMRQGYSLAAFAAHIGVARSRINDWMAAHEEFREAVSQGKGARLLHWEGAALRVAEKGGGPGTATIIMFGLKNMGGDEWTAPEKVDHTSSDRSMSPPTRIEIVAARDGDGKD